jgi:hypothetical protein
MCFHSFLRPYSSQGEHSAATVNVRQENHKKTDLSNMRTSREDLSTSGGEPKSQGPVHVEKKGAGMIHALAEA